MQRAIPTLTASLMIIAGQGPLAGQEALCEGAERFLQETMFMIVLSESDTIDDWRTREKVTGCRVTAAGSSSLPSAEVARSFYQIIAESGWSRTPDPRDAPNEASLRFRRDSVDCLFNYYDSSMSLGTDAEMIVSDAIFVEEGESLYNFLVLCMPAAPAVPRG